MPAFLFALRACGEATRPPNRNADSPTRNRQNQPWNEHPHLRTRSCSGRLWRVGVSAGASSGAGQPIPSSMPKSACRDAGSGPPGSTAGIGLDMLKRIFHLSTMLLLVALLLVALPCVPKKRYALYPVL